MEGQVYIRYSGGPCGSTGPVYSFYAPLFFWSPSVMVQMLKERFILFFRRVSEAVPACILVMTKGSLEIITPDHWVAAIKTGAIAGAVMVFLSLIEPKNWLHNRYTTGALTGFATAGADFLAHPASFSGEAIATGVAAAGLCILYSFVVKN